MLQEKNTKLRILENQLLSDVQTLNNDIEAGLYLRDKEGLKKAKTKVGVKTNKLKRWKEKN